MYFLLKKLLFIAIVFFISFFCPAKANVWQYPVEFKNIIENIPDIQNIDCKFKQEKLLPNIIKPIISYGNFKFIKNEGVYFYTNFPIQSKVDYTNKNYKQINEVINAIAGKKYKKIEKEFDFYFEKKSANDWIIGLKPKDKNAEFISFIAITGCDYINKIEIQMENGSKTTIWFEK